MTALVRPLEPPWRAILDGLARARRFPTTNDVAELGALVARLSTRYNAGERAPRDLAARLLFSFPRDVPKTAGAVRELVATGALRLPQGRALRVLDVGAGLGAATWGLARALDAAGERGSIHATLVDDEAEALALAEAIARARGGEGGVDVSVETRAAKIDGARLVGGGDLVDGDRGWDAILASQVLSELEADVATHVALLRALLAALAPHGSLVVVEPALRDRTRHLHALRDALLVDRAAGLPRAGVFAPCLHEEPCPALARAGDHARADWCHEDLPVDLPEWLVPVARAAGLRWQRLTFAYLVLRKDGDTLARRLGGEERFLLRVVSDALVSKGKQECFLCGHFAPVGAGGATCSGPPLVGRRRAMRLDRHASSTNAAWAGLARGDVIATSPPLSAENPRITTEIRIDVRTVKS